ncbi:MAG: ABC-F family ATP-binding cassette domain-containing protein [Prevotellaceae bacterium]|jgi:ATP-binding cassette subfamily F protein uup|nr:ABC-F family ATP-binding cassette domain-containing protein [Prevotellaceae bacterium]
MINYLQAEKLSKSYGESVMFNEVSFTIDEGQRIGLIGCNGCGKTSLLNMIAGYEGCDAGSITLRKDLKIGYLEQDPRFPNDLTVLQACFFATNETLQTIALYEKTLASDDKKNMQNVLENMDRLKAWDYEQRAKQILTRLKITDFDKKIAELSGGQIKRVALANALILEPELLILDEPTNHLDIETTEWLEDYLKRERMSLLMVTHDRYFLDRLCSVILEIDRGRMFRYAGNYSYFLEKKKERIENENAEIDRANNLLIKELDWMRRGPQARAGKAKARIDAFYDLQEKAARRHEDKNVTLDIKASYIGKKIFEAKQVCKSFGKLKILDDFNYVFSRYEKMGVAGDNGTGKSTFVRMLIGEIAPDTGNFDLGETVRFGYYGQQTPLFDDDAKVIDLVRDIAETVDTGEGRRLSASQFLQHFLFAPDKQHDFVRKLSGGERRRLYLCTVLMRNPNFLILDEPTNDLDIITLNVLEDYLCNFKGCLIVISHDRYFLDKTVDHLLIFKGNAEIKDFPGNYSDYLSIQKDAAKEIETKNSAKEAKPDIREKNNQTKTKKLSFKEQRELETLEKEISELENEKTLLANLMNSENLLHEELVRNSTRMAEVMKQIDLKSERWLELSLNE